MGIQCQYLYQNGLTSCVLKKNKGYVWYYSIKSIVKQRHRGPRRIKIRTFVYLISGAMLGRERDKHLVRNEKLQPNELLESDIMYEYLSKITP